MGEIARSSSTRRGRRRAVTIAALLVAGLTPLGAPAGAAPSSGSSTSIVRVSAYLDGAQAAGDSFGNDLTADGRVVLYTVQGQVSTLDTRTGVRARHDINTTGTAVAGAVSNARMSDDARFVVFDTNAALDPVDTNATFDVYLRDRDTDVDGVLDEVGASSTELVSRGPNGAIGNDISWSPAMSEDGRFVTFQGRSTNWGTTGWPLYLRDRQSGTTVRVSVGTVQSPRSAMSGDGRFIAYVASARDEGITWPHGEREVILLDRSTGARSVVGRTAGDFAMGLDPTISRDGRYVGFQSYSSALLPGDANNRPDGFVWDRSTGAVETVNRTAAGAWGTGSSTPPTFSSDGRYVAFSGSDGNLVPDDTNGQLDGFVRDMATASVQRATLTHDGQQANNQALAQAVSDDGQRVLIDSYAANLVPADTNNRPDAFLRTGLDYGGPPAVTRSLTITVSGTGTGSVTSNPAGIACPPTCTASFDDGAVVSVAAEPQSGSSFGGFSGDCSGTSPCQLTMTADRTVDAAFESVPTPAPPDAVDDSYSVPAGRTLTVPAPGVLGNDSDPEGSSIEASMLNPPEHGSLTIGADGSFTYSPAAGFRGADGFSYRATNARGGSDTALVTLSVTAPLPDNPVVWATVPNGGLWVGGAGTAPTQVLSGDALQPAWSPDRSQIAFASRRGGTWDIWIVNADGSGLRNVTNDAAIDSYPAWSPDGRLIAYSSERDGDNDVWTVAVAGGAQRRITSTAGYDGEPAWSPAGNRVAYRSAAGIKLVGADGSGMTTLVDSPASVEESPSWSPDGTLIAFTSLVVGQPAAIDVIGVDGTNRRTVPTGGDASAPSWSPDGAHLAFSSHRSGNADIWLAAIDGSGSVNISNRTDIDVAPDWGQPPRSVDQAGSITFRAREDLDRNGRAEWKLYAVSPGVEPVRLTSTPVEVQEVAGALSPDGTLVAMATVYEGMRALGIFRAGAAEPHIVFDGVGDARNIEWSRDGSSLAFTGGMLDGSFGVFVVPAIGGTPRLVATAPSWGGVAFSPSGSALAASLCTSVSNTTTCRLDVIDLSTGAATTVLSLPVRVHPRWRDAATLLFTRFSGSGPRQVEALPIGRAAPDPTGIWTDFEFEVSPDGLQLATTGSPFDGYDHLDVAMVDGSETARVFDTETHPAVLDVVPLAWSSGSPSLRTLVVTTGGDPDPNDDGCHPVPGDCTLAEAIEDSNETTDDDVSTTIVVPPGTIIHGPLPDIERPVQIIGDVSPDGGTGGAGGGLDPAQTECGPTRVHLIGNGAGPGRAGLRVAVGLDPARATVIRGFLITGFDGDGVQVRGSAKLRFRCIGSGSTASSGQPTQSNGGDGFDISGSRDVVLFPSVGAQMNASDGLEVSGRSRGVRALGASLADSGDLGIDLGIDGIDPTDAGDGDDGPNGLVNRPRILRSSATSDPTKDRVFLEVAHQPLDAPFRVDVYLNAWCDPSGSGEAMQWLGAGLFSDGLGAGARIVRVDLPFQAPLHLLTATVTTSEGTSELSGCLHRRANDDADDDGTSTAVGPNRTITGSSDPSDGTGDRTADPGGLGDGVGGATDPGPGGTTGGDGGGDDDAGRTPGDGPADDATPDPEGYIVVGVEGEVTVDAPGLLVGVGGNAPLQALREPGGDIPPDAWRLASNGVVTLDARGLRPGSYSGRYTVVDRDDDHSPTVAILFLVLKADGGIPDEIQPQSMTATPRPDRYRAAPGQQLTFTADRSVLANDWRGTESGLTAELTSAGSLGARLALDAGGTLTVDTRGVAEGTYTATYRLRAAGVDRGTTTIGVVVDNGNECPTARDDTYTVRSGEQFRVTGALGALGNDSDADGDTISARLEGVFSKNDISFATDGTITLDARRASPGSFREFRYFAVDPSGEVCGRATVRLNIVANAPPIANLNFFEVYPGQRFSLPSRGVLGNDLDPDGSEFALKASLVTGISGWNVTIGFSGGTTATVPPRAALGTVVSATYQVMDALNAKSRGELRFRVVPKGQETFIPTPPVARDDLHYRVHAGETLVVTGADGALANDTPASDVFAEGTAEESAGARFTIRRDGGFTMSTTLADVGRSFSQTYYAVREGYSGVRSPAAATVRVEVVAPRVQCTTADAGLHLRADDGESSPTELLSGSVEATHCWDGQSVVDAWVQEDGGEPFDFDTSKATSAADFLFFGWKVAGENDLAHTAITTQGAARRLDVTTEYPVCLDWVEFATTAFSGLRALSETRFVGGAFRKLVQHLDARRLADDLPRLVRWIDDTVSKAGIFAGPIRGALEDLPLLGAVFRALNSGVEIHPFSVVANQLTTRTIRVMYEGEPEDLTIADMLDRWADGAADSLDDFVPIPEDPTCEVLSNLWDGYLPAEGTTTLQLRADGSTFAPPYGDGPYGFMEWFVRWVWLFDVGRNGDPELSWEPVEANGDVRYRTCDFTRVRPDDQPVPGESIDGRPPVPCDSTSRRG